jgi:hypothetical protein
MKVQVYFKFSKNITSKKMKSPSSMRNGRFHPPQVKGQGSKDWRGNSQWAFLKIPYSCCPPFWATIVNSCWLALAHAHPAHTSLKIFKHS